MPYQKRILFLCTGNSCRSQMAEGLMNQLGGDRFVAFSAGSHPAGYVHPLAIETMAEMKIDISNNKSKSLDLYLHESWDIIITVCDKAKESCPVFPGHKAEAHWNFPDPAEFEGSDDEKRAFFDEVASEIERRIRLLLTVPEDKLSLKDYQREVRRIGLK